MSRVPMASGLKPHPPPHSCHQKCSRKSSLHFPGDVFATPERAGGSPGQGPMPYLDDDIPLLSVEEEPGESRAGLGRAAGHMVWGRPVPVAVAKAAHGVLTQWPSLEGCMPRRL